MCTVCRLVTAVFLAATLAACSPPQEPESTSKHEPLNGLVDGLTSGSVKVVDLTQPLNAETPIIQLPPPFANTPGFTPHLISNFGDPQNLD